MIEVIVLACSIVQGALCKEFTLYFNPSAKYGVVNEETVSEVPATPMVCNRYGQIAISQWAAGNSNWSLKKWRCNRTGLQAKA